VRAVTVPEPGGPDALVVTDVPDPVPGPDQVVLAVAAAGVNRADLLERAGHYPSPPGAPPWPGLEVSGTVVAMGDDVVGWAVGDAACALLGGGGYAEQVAVDAGHLLPLPDGVDLVDGAALPEAVCTAWSNLVDVGRLRAGEHVLIHGGSGGVGSVAIQLAAALGAHVLTTAGGAERAARCRGLGATVAIDYRTQDVAAVVRDATGGRGVDVVLDVLGAGALATNLESLATEGRLVVIGLQRGRRAEIDLNVLMSKRAAVVGTTLRSRPAAQKTDLVAAVRAHVWPMVADGRVRPLVHARVPLDRAADAHRLLDSGEVFGKLLLVP